MNYLNVPESPISKAGRVSFAKVACATFKGGEYLQPGTLH